MRPANATEEIKHELGNAARAGAPCPGNIPLAEATGFDVSHVRWCIRKLIDRGEIAIEHRNAVVRRITLLVFPYEGLQTGWTERVYRPRPEYLERRKKVEQMNKSGLNAGQIAERVGITRRRVLTVLRTIGRADKTPDPLSKDDPGVYRPKFLPARNMTETEIKALYKRQRYDADEVQSNGTLPRYMPAREATFRGGGASSMAF